MPTPRLAKKTVPSSPARVLDAVAVDDLHLPQHSNLPDVRGVVDGTLTENAPSQRRSNPSATTLQQPSVSKKHGKAAPQPLMSQTSSRIDRKCLGQGVALPSVAQQVVDQLVVQLAQERAEANRREAALQQMLQRASQVVI